MRVHWLHQVITAIGTEVERGIQGGSSESIEKPHVIVQGNIPDQVVIESGLIARRFFDRQ